MVKENKIKVDEELSDCTTEEVQEELSDTQPRYLIYSYAVLHEDGHRSYPLLFVYYHPRGCGVRLSMQYAGCLKLVQSLIGVERVCSINEKIVILLLQEKS